MIKKGSGKAKRDDVGIVPYSIMIYEPILSLGMGDRPQK